MEGRNRQRSLVECRINTPSIALAFQLYRSERYSNTEFSSKDMHLKCQFSSCRRASQLKICLLHAYLQGYTFLTLHYHLGN